MRYIVLVISILIFSTNSVKHPVHVSVTSAEYFSESEKFEISIRLFTDDFEKILLQTYKTQLQLGTKPEHPQTNVFIRKYITKHLAFFNAGKPLPSNFELLKKEFDNEENTITIYLKFKSKSTKNIVVKNSLMTDLYSDQQNLFIFTVGTQQLAEKFDADLTTQSFNF